MAKLRSSFGIALIWVATVAGVSATAWFAIDKAGRDLTGSDVSALRPPTVSTDDTASTPGSGPTASDGTPRPSASAPTSISQSTPRDKSVSLAGGQVSVRCTGATIMLRIAQPDNGWGVDVDASGPTKVVVAFKRGENEGVATHLTAVCANGTPAFTFDNES